MNDSTRTIRTFALAGLVMVLTFLATNRESPALQETTTPSVTQSGAAAVTTKNGEGMKITAAVETETVHATTAQTMTGEGLGRTPPTPRMAGVLLIGVPLTESAKPESAAAEKPALPDAASDLPVIVLLGALSIAGWVVLRWIHSKRHY